MRLRALIERERVGFYDPGYDDFLKYREAVARHGAFVSALEELRLAINEEEDD